MANYIISITVFSIISSFICIAVPDNLRSYVKMLSSIALILIILIPLNKNIDLSKLYDFDIQMSGEFNNTDKNEIAAVYLAKSISATIKNDWKIETKRIVVKTHDTSAFDVDSVTVYIKGTTNDTSIISQKIEELYKCKTKIIQE